MDTVSRIAPAALPLTAPLDAAMARRDTLGGVIEVVQAVQGG